MFIKNIIVSLVALLTISFNSTESVDYNTIKVLQATEFPIYSDELFYLFFSSRKGDFPIYSVLIFIIRDGVSTLEKGYFYPGFFYELEYPFLGEYVQLLVATVQTNHSISVRVQFNERSNYKQLEVRYGEFVSRDKMNYAKENFLLYTTMMHSCTVQLYIRTKLSLHTLTNDGRTDGVTVQEPAYLICRGSHGNPKQKVKLTAGYRHKVLSETYDSVLNEHKMQVQFTVLDHRSTYECSTLDPSLTVTTETTSTAVVYVFHHPTKLHLEPSYYSTMPNGSDVKCVADDGYPEPKILWYYMRGPINADWYFNFYQDQLSMLPNAPIGSQWIFKCVAENVIPNSQLNSTSLLFKFTVIHSSYRKLILMASSAGGVVCVAAIIIVLVVILRPKKTPRRHPKPKPEIVLVAKELAFDPDTAGSIRLSQSTECVPDEAPRYEDINNGDIDINPQVVGSLSRKFLPKEVGTTCYV